MTHSHFVFFNSDKMFGVYSERLNVTINKKISIKQQKVNIQMVAKSTCNVIILLVKLNYCFMTSVAIRSKMQIFNTVDFSCNIF